MQVVSKTSWVTLGLIVILSLLFVGIEVFFSPYRRALALETGALNAGQFYRLITAHWIHLNPHHTWLSIAGLILVGITMAPVLHPGRLLATVGTSLCMISFGWWILQPAGPTFVGFSGILYGIYTVGVLLNLTRGFAWLGWIMLAGLIAKLGYESLYGPLPNANQDIAGRVSTLSHALGAFGGILSGPWHPLAKPVLIGLATLALLGALRHETSLTTALVSLVGA